MSAFGRDPRFPKQLAPELEREQERRLEERAEEAARAEAARPRRRRWKLWGRRPR